MSNLLSPQQYSLFLALCSNAAFGVSCIIFARYSERWGALLVNLTKALLSTLAFLLLSFALSWFSMTVSPALEQEVSPWVYCWLIASGTLGLGLADLALMKSMALMGAARTLLCYAFVPVVIAVYAFLLWGEPLAFSHLVSFTLFFVCLYLFFLDQQRVEAKSLKASLWAILFACAGVLLDAAGIILSRMAFMHSQLGSIEVCLWRGLGAILFLGMLFLRPGPRAPRLRLAVQFKQALVTSVQTFVTTFSPLLWASFIGTFFSLLCYLKAISIGPLALVTTISMTSPLWAQAAQWWWEGKVPGRYTQMALALFSLTLFWQLSQL